MVVRLSVPWTPEGTLRMTSIRARTALMLFGAGASLDYGAPSTGALTDLLRDAVLSDRWMRVSGGADAYARISSTLAGYYRGGEDAVNFEQIYHCAHELIYARPPSAGAVDTFRPALSAFLAAKVDLDERALVSLIGFMADTIFETMASACARPALGLAPLARFIADVRADCVTRIYTTNYDDFILQSSPDLFTGFPEATVAAGVRRFDGREFWAGARRDCVFHLHGGVHLGFHNGDPGSRIGDLFWYDDREEAKRNASYMGSGQRRLDGSQVHRSAIVTGLDKLSRLQGAPMSYYYASFARDALAADVIYIVGYGLGDVHLNNWLHEARAHPIGCRSSSSTTGARVSPRHRPSMRPTTGSSRCGTSCACTSATSRGGMIIRTTDGRSTLEGPARSGTAASRRSSRIPTAMAPCCSVSA